VFLPFLFFCTRAARGGAGLFFGLRKRAFARLFALRCILQGTPFQRGGTQNFLRALLCRAAALLLQWLAAHLQEETASWGGKWG